MIINWRKLNSLLVVISLLLLVVGLLCQHQIIIKLNNAIKSKDAELSGYSLFVKESFSNSLTEQEQLLIDDCLLLNGDNIGNLVVAVPVSVCGACFDSLLLYLQDTISDRNKVYFFFANMDEQTRRKLIEYGFSNVCSTTIVSDLDEITLHRISNNGWRNLYLEYRDGYDDILTLFLNS